MGAPVTTVRIGAAGTMTRAPSGADVSAVDVSVKSPGPPTSALASATVASDPPSSLSVANELAVDLAHAEKATVVTRTVRKSSRFTSQPLVRTRDLSEA